ncbi:MAG: CoA-binding protein [Chloroflexi bacterium]|nr:CoA-binding protein [Chloroflexota bacterium]
MAPEKKNLDRAFNPRSVAVVGDKQQTNYMWLRSVSTFQGKVYSVQIDERELPGIAALGVPNYPSLVDIPEPIDYVIVAVPRKVAPKVVADCIQKKVGGAAFFTSGFAETNTEEGIRLQKVLTEMAKAGGLNLIGPNCVGIFNPSIGLRHNAEQYAGERGVVGFISQSGTHASQFSLVGAIHGIKISKSVSYGNAIVLDSTDYLDYLAQDEETKVIGLYIEGVKDGRRFYQALKEAAQIKPVLLWKGGQTDAGARAASSHTASLATSQLLWDAMIRQCGTITVENLDQMIDTIKLLLCSKPASGLRMGLMSMTGGQSVISTDAFVKAGLEVSPLSSQSYEQLATFFNIIGGSYRNPLDVSSNFASLELVMKMLNILAEDENVDAVAMEVSVGFSRDGRRGPAFWDGLVSGLADYKNKSDKPFFAIVTPAHREATAIEMRNQLTDKYIPSFPSFQRAATAFKKVVEYYHHHSVAEV